MVNDKINLDQKTSEYKVGQIQIQLFPWNTIMQLIAIIQEYAVFHILPTVNLLLPRLYESRKNNSPNTETPSLPSHYHTQPAECAAGLAPQRHDRLPTVCQGLWCVASRPESCAMPLF